MDFTNWIKLDIENLRLEEKHKRQDEICTKCQHERSMHCYQQTRSEQDPKYCKIFEEKVK